MDSRDRIIDEVSNVLTHLKRAMHVYALQGFDHLGLSFAQLGLLRKISDCQPVSQATLAKQMQLTPGAISQLIDGLEYERCIVRTADEHDRRISQLTVSSRGEQILQEFYLLVKQTLARSLEDVSTEDIETYIRVQQNIASWLESQYSNNTNKKETA